VLGLRHVGASRLRRRAPSGTVGQMFHFERGRRQVPETRRGPDFVEVASPCFDAYLRVGAIPKLIIVHGWSDGADPAMASVQYYGSVVSTMGQNAVDQFFRLYMVPGVYHNASRGPGPTAFPGPMLKALERWVEDKVAPTAVTAASYNVDGDPSSGIVRTRPLCPYPAVAVYRGTGSRDEARNFVCKVTTN
jgi:hypothetical protein